MVVVLGEAQPAPLTRTKLQLTPQILGRATWLAATRVAAGAFVPLSYLGLVLLLWLPFGPRSGMGYETAFPYDSETSSFWQGFFYSDPLRPYTSVFYNLGYHLSVWLGIAGSFLGVQLVYAALWWGRGFLAYLIVSALFPRKRLLAVLIGLLVLVHTADHATNWVGQLNQHGMIFWTLLSIYALVRAFQAQLLISTVVFTLGSMWAVRMALWSYESPLFIILLVPLLLIALRFRFRLRTILIAGAYYISPISYIWDNYQRYSSDGTSSYQQSVLRSDMSPGPIISDLWFNVQNSLEFWNWGWGMPPITAHAEQRTLGLAGACVAAAVMVGASLGARGSGPLFPSRRSLLTLLGSGILILAASFPAYVILSSARQLWRTQFLSGIGAAMVFASVIALLATYARRRWAVTAVTGLAAGAIAYFGVSASFATASYHYSVWSKDKHTIEEVLSVAPRVKPGTLLVLTNVPKTADSFGDNMWFDFSVRLAYPRELVSGVYFLSGGLPSTDENLALRGQMWHFTNTGYPPLLRHVPIRKTVVIRYSADGAPVLLQKLPKFLHATPEAASAYAPEGRIEAGPPSPYAVRRYGPITDSGGS